MRGVRRAIAANVARSRREIPEATTWVDVDATDLWQLRTELIEATGVRISPFAIICRAVVAALHVFPILNSRLDDDGKHIHVLEHVHLGIAASTDHGLVVPVVRDAHRRTILELAAETARLTECARAGSLTPADTTGSTFTVNNYGVLGVDGGDPIINLPEVAILGVGRIVDRPRVHDGQVVARKSVELVLAFDHRVCDGKEAGGFLRLLADMIEDSRTLVAAL
jgi:pyruvate dehydrogenase E2 component (dihydrolipoamide acetyltransferase)